MPSPVVIILAAGRGERFLASGATTHKLDTLLNNQPVLWHIIQVVKAAGLGWHLVRPEGGTGGMGESIVPGVKATSEVSGWLILPADLPLIQPASLLHVAEGLRVKPVVVPHYQQRRGHPVGFSREYLPSLIALSGDTGAKHIVRDSRREGKVMALSLNDAGTIHDIDTWSNFHLAARLLRIRAR
ncbi:nucleotidyltransferase family protein [Winslowiella iniecta]|uniref:Molybdopterin-guanine dinucleotide biosynthesis protein MobA n=1 Tax=Winslowiella iniecta TaxID=1560201 RepID=A0A0L7T4D5_9GAMM|nr:NTP transferase domain-containing protein [Winslowiella iniecta]KOC90269.1 molybdopterin-guanine dinucleotide biosynthesis protein MobA [Winslowiella iniecta]KOC94769.1 molybdopterin-guanine dinucleotide biosynthesis protein MobA [Winslowiella iniecta]